ncbi:MAG: GH25 family lysozyme, partial [Bacteroidales bacterium]|nr:GH25 family lysozyme [Bacteroidales bacterium]
QHNGFDGIDVSSHQKEIDWDKVAQDSSIQFVYVKVTEGTTYQDRLGQKNIKKARELGLNVGAYHYLSTKSQAKTQFENFKKHTPKETNLIPMLDIEEQGNFSNKELIRLAKEVADLMEEEYGVKPIIYTTLGKFNSILYPTFKDYTIYLGYYSETPPKFKDRRQHYLWQFADTNHIDGIKKPVDQTRFVNLTIDDILLPEKK